MVSEAFFAAAVPLAAAAFTAALGLPGTSPGGSALPFLGAAAGLAGASLAVPAVAPAALEVVPLPAALEPSSLGSSSCAVIVGSDGFAREARLRVYMASLRGVV